MLRRDRSLLAFALVAVVAGSAHAESGKPARGELVELKGIPVLRLSGTPRERGYAHGYYLAREIVDLFTRYMPFVARDRERYEKVIRPEVAGRFAFPKEVREEIAGMFRGIRARLPRAGLATHLGRPLDELDLLAMQAMPDWHPFACSSFVAWGRLAPDGPLVGRNLDFFVHPVLLENHMLIVNARSGEKRAWVSLGWPGLVGALTGMNEDGVVAFIHDANAPMLESQEDMLPRMLALRAILERAGRARPAADATELLRDVPTRWGGLIFVAGPRAEEIEGAVGVLERDARGTTLRTAQQDPVAEGVPAFACTNHFRVRARPASCERYDTIVRRLGGLSREGRALDFKTAFGLLHDVRQRITMQSFVANLRTRWISLRLLRPRPEDSPRVDFDWDVLMGTTDEHVQEPATTKAMKPPMHADARR